LWHDCMWGLKKITKKLSKDTAFVGAGLNPGFPRCETITPPTQS